MPSEHYKNSVFVTSNYSKESIYKTFAQSLPIVDYHCHIIPEEVYKDRVFKNLTDIWLKNDHYKWRLMRANGIDEAYITGNKSDKEKFDAWVRTIEKSWGNPLYTWCHMELEFFFNIKDTICQNNADKIWEESILAITKQKLSPRKCLEMCHVTCIATTDSPFSDLHYHTLLKTEDLPFSVIPTFRLDTALDFSKVSTLLVYEKQFNTSLQNLENYIQLLKDQCDYFQKMGCRSFDLGIGKVYFKKITSNPSLTYQQLYEGKEISFKAKKDLELYIIEELVQYCKRYDWVLQLHIGAFGNLNTLGYHMTESDKGFAAVGNQDDFYEQIVYWMNHLNQLNSLPKIIFYNADPNLNHILQTLIQCFQFNTDGMIAKLQQGPAWWFLDTYHGNKNQLINLAEQSSLLNFIGMTTDSRSFTSYIRHEYFRKILAEIISDWLSKGIIPNDEQALHNAFKRICYQNALDYFNLEKIIKKENIS